MSNRVASHYRFNWRGGNQFSLLVDGEHYFPAMLEAIDNARHFIALEMYLVESGSILTRFIDAFCRATERGVHVFLLLDDFGARGMHPRDRERLTEAGVRLDFYNPFQYGRLRRNLFRDHRKLLLIDCDLAFVGGTGLTDQFINGNEHVRPWHEVMIAIRGPVVEDWRTLFIDTWPATHDDTRLLTRCPDCSRAQSADQLGRVTISQMSNRQEIKHSLVKRLRAAEHKVRIATAYFVPSWKIRRALIRAARRGVDVGLILPGPHTDHPAVRHAGRRFYHSLLRHGVKVYEYQPGFNHAKLYLVDHWCSIGSSNVDRWNLLWNLEGNQEIEDQNFSKQLEALFEKDLIDCHEILPAQWQARPWHSRLLEWFWGRVDLMIQRLIRRR